MPGDCQNLFVITKFRYIEERFHVFYYYGGKVNRSLYQRLRYIEVHYIKVLLHYIRELKNHDDGFVDDDRK